MRYSASIACLQDLGLVVQVKLWSQVLVANGCDQGTLLLRNFGFLLPAYLDLNLEEVFLLDSLGTAALVVQRVLA